MTNSPEERWNTRKTVSDRRGFLGDFAHIVAAGVTGSFLTSFDDLNHGGPRSRDLQSKERRGGREGLRGSARSRERSEFERFAVPNVINSGLMFWLIKEARNAYKELTSIPVRRRNWK